MKQRINFGKVQPGAYDAMEALDAFVEHSSVSKEYLELIKIRASQIMAVLIAQIRIRTTH